MLRSWLRQNGHYLQLQINLKNIFICRCKLFCVFFICPKYSQAHIIKLTSMWSFHPQNFCLQLLGSVRIWRHINIRRLCSSCHPSSGIFRTKLLHMSNRWTIRHFPRSTLPNQLSSRALSLFLSIVRSVVQSWEKWHAWWGWTDIKTPPGYLTRKRQKQFISKSRTVTKQRISQKSFF